MVLVKLRDTAELPAGGVLRVFPAHALLNKSLRQQAQMLFDFAAKLAVAIAFHEQAAKPGDHAPKSPHSSPPRP
jgi:hypothetical protein